MSNEFNFKIKGVSSAIFGGGLTVMDDSNTAIISNKQLFSDSIGNVSLGIGALGSVGSRYKIFGDNGSEVGYKHFVGFADATQHTAKGYSNIVVIGASIIEGAFGQNLGAPNSNATQAMLDQGVVCSVYGWGFSGYTITNIQPKITEAFAAFPADTLFVIHIGGNDVTNTRPYATRTEAEKAALSTSLDSLFNLIEPRRDDVIVASLTFRDYDDSTINNEQNGSLPFITGEFKPRFNTRFQNSDGMPVVDFYNWCKNTYETTLLPDNVHHTPAGQAGMRAFLAERVKYIFDGAAMPAPVIQPPQVSLAPVLINFGLTAPYGKNFVTPSVVTTSSVLSLTAEDNEQSGLTYKAVPTTTVEGVAGIGDNDAGLTTNAPIAPLFVNSVLAQSVYAATGHSITHEITGFTVGASVSVSLVASRPSSTRITRYSEIGNLTNNVSLDTSTAPPQNPVELTLTADSNGKIAFIQESLSNNFCYIGGMLITRL